MTTWPTRRSGWLPRSAARDFVRGSTWGTSGKLARQLKWAADQGARFCLIYGEREWEAGEVIVRNMASGEQTTHPVDRVAEHFA
ncbi:His/Gly/Thr/Pro-type tRNA ligase C-terminal domain-containing protein [Streptomyces sp. LaBMicrA B280]